MKPFDFHGLNQNQIDTWDLVLPINILLDTESHARKIFLEKSSSNVAYNYPYIISGPKVLLNKKH